MTDLDQAHMERCIQSPARIYEVRMSLRSLVSEDRYKEVTADYSKLIFDRKNAKPEEGILESAVEVAHFMNRQGQGDATGWIMAAAVEMIEAEQRAAAA